MRTRTKVRLFTRVVQSFVHGSISWKLDKDVKRAITHWTALCTHRITGKTVHEESENPLVKMVQWIQYWQNQKVGIACSVYLDSHSFRNCVNSGQDHHLLSSPGAPR